MKFHNKSLNQNFLLAQKIRLVQRYEYGRVMKVFGYKEKEANEYGLLQMSEVTFQASPDLLRTVGKFFIECADLIEKNKGKFDHAHIQDGGTDWDEGYPNIVIAEE